jgi:hypothetical protein
MFLRLFSRKYNVGLFATNNLMELFIRSVSNSIPRNRKHLNRLDEIYTYLVKSLKPMQNVDFNRTPVGKEFTASMAKSIEMISNGEISIEKIDKTKTDIIHEYEIYSGNSIYLVNAQFPVCNCPYFCKKQQHLCNFFAHS